MQQSVSFIFTKLTLCFRLCYAISMRKAKAMVQRIITAALSGQLNEAQALELYQLAPEMVQLTLLQKLF